MFNVGDRVRVTKFMGAASFSSHVGATGTVNKVNATDPFGTGGGDGWVYSYHVTLDRPQKIAAQWSKQTAVDILYYPEELEYEDNRKGAAFGDIVAWGGGSSGCGDYVRLINVSQCSHWVGPMPKNVFRFWTNYRQGDTALIVTCPTCGEVMGSGWLQITPDDVENIMYACVEPSLNYDIEPRDND